MSTQEKNRATLERALQELPWHEPDDRLWQDIRQQLADTPLQVAVNRLPQYDPPAETWENIARELKPETTLLRRISWRNWSYAAGFALLLALTWWIGRMLPSNSGLDVTISYRTEEVDNSLLNLDWSEDEEDFAMLEDICHQHPFLCNRPNIQDLRKQLNELSRAKSDLVDVLGPYGTDLNLIDRLNAIEMERTRLLKQILTEVI